MVVHANNTRDDVNVLKEWEDIQSKLFSIVLFTSPTQMSWREVLQEEIVHCTDGRARIWWQQSIEKEQRGTCWRQLEIRCHTTLYGILELAPGYLQSDQATSIPKNFAHLCALLLNLLEHRALMQCQMDRIPPPCAEQSMRSLTMRERDILLGLVYGESEQASAQRLCIEPTTVRTHRQRLYRHLEVHDPYSAVLRSFALRLIDWLDFPIHNSSKLRS